MPYVLLLYGAAFVAAGFALALQARATGRTQPLPRVALVLLAAFALVHGASEWATMAAAIEVAAHGHAAGELTAAALALLAISFALLFAFGSALLVEHDRRTIQVVAGALVPLAVCGFLLSRLDAGTSPAPTRGAIEAVIRYCLGIPACLAAALGLFTMRRSVASEETRTSQYVGLSAGVFLGYGVLAGLVVPRAPFPPASVLNTTAFQENTLIPVEALRGACAIAIVLLMSEAFIVEPFQRMQRELARAHARMRALLRSELREPLEAIERGTSALEALAVAPDAGDRWRGVVRAIAAGARVLRARVGDLLDAAELDSRHLRLASESFEPKTLLAAAIDRQVREGDRPIQVRVDCPDGLASVTADRARVEQVLRILLATANRSSRPGTEIVVRAEQEHGTIAISVTSQGPGITAYELPYVFSRRDRPPGADRDDAPGAIGLHLARGLVEAMGGQISVDSAPDRDTTFRFTLPLARPAGPQSTVARSAE